MIGTSSFGDYRLFTLSDGDLTAEISDLGGTVVSLNYRGRETVLGYGSPQEYLAGTAYIGALVGRVGNRLGGAAFQLDAVRYALTPNEGPNQLHGGPDAFDRRRWDAQILEGDALRLSLTSPDGDNGFPGTLQAAVTFRVRGGALRVDFEGESDRDTVFAPTQHMYFDLSGRRKALEAQLQISAERFVEPGPGLIPTGRLLPVRGQMDYRQLRPVGQDLDHAFVLAQEQACTLRDGDLEMQIWTDFPALQVYTGAFLESPFPARGGIALEPEHLPDSPNQPGFPSIVLRKGQHYHHWAEYRFRQVED